MAKSTKKPATKIVQFELYCNLFTENNPNGDGSWKYAPDNQGVDIQYGEHTCTEMVLYRKDGKWVTSGSTRDYTGWKRTRITLPVEFIGADESEVKEAGFAKKIMVDVFKDTIALGDGIEPIEE